MSNDTTSEPTGSLDTSKDTSSDPLNTSNQTPTTDKKCKNCDRKNPLNTRKVIPDKLGKNIQKRVADIFKNSTSCNQLFITSDNIIFKNKAEANAYATTLKNTVVREVEKTPLAG